jgi:sugar/nucleoside kinase (ribokinase family)
MSPSNAEGRNVIPSDPIQYLVMGHLTKDLTDAGPQLGGTAAFSALTATSLGLKAGIISSFSDELDVSALNACWIYQIKSEKSTTFKNISDGIHRTQFLFQKAKQITPESVPEFPYPIPILHLGPVADEVNSAVMEAFPQSLKCLTPQGWFRDVNDHQQVVPKPWDGYLSTLSQADIAVISLEDVGGDEEQISEMAASVPVFVVTENVKGARVYWHNDARFFSAPEVKYINDTGAGDIFATAFFYRYFITRDPWEAGRFAVQLASKSVTRERLNSIPEPDEIQSAIIEVLGH